MSIASSIVYEQVVDYCQKRIDFYKQLKETGSEQERCNNEARCLAYLDVINRFKGEE